MSSFRVLQVDRELNEKLDAALNAALPAGGDCAQFLERLSQELVPISGVSGLASAAGRVRQIQEVGA